MHLPQTLFCSYPHSAFSISPSLFNHPEAFGHALRSSFLDSRTPSYGPTSLLCFTTTLSKKSEYPVTTLLSPIPFSFQHFLLIFN